MIYFIGILAIIGGVAMVMKTEWLLRNIGTNAWAEEHLGVEGGSRIFYKLIGVGFILFGFLLMGGFIEKWVVGIFGGTVLR